MAKCDEISDDPSPSSSVVLGKKKNPVEQCRIVRLTILIFACFVGGIFGVTYATGASDDKFQYDLMIYVVLPLLAASIICILPAIVMQGKLTHNFLQNMSDGDESVKSAVKSSAANISLVCALVATIAIPLMYVDAPDSNELDRIFWYYWYYGFASIASSCSFAGMIMGILVLMYIDPLSNDAALVFIREFKGAVGLPFALLVGSCIFLMAAFAAYTMYTYDVVFFICHVAEFAAVMFSVTLFQHYCSKYKNEVDSLDTYEKSLLGLEHTDKDMTTSEYLKSLSSADLVHLMRESDNKEDEGSHFILEAADAFESHLIDGAMLRDLNYEIVMDILKEAKIGDVINVCKKLGIAISK